MKTILNNNNTISNNNTKGEELTMMNLTVKELKGIAKEEGIVGYSKLRKAELVAAIETNRAETAVVNEVINTNTNNNNTKGEKTMTISTNIGENIMKKDILLSAIAEGNVEAIESMINRAQKDVTFNMVKKHSKALENVAMRQIVFSIEMIEHNGKFEPKMKIDTNIAVTQESNAIRAAHTEDATVADSGLVINMRTTNEIVSISLKKSVYKAKGKEADAIRQRIFRVLLGKGRETLNLLISTSGLGKVFTNVEIAASQMKEGDKLITYKFTGVTASGLRSKSLVGAAVKMKLKGVDTINCDRSILILDKSVDGCFTGSFMETRKDAKKVFKALKDKATQFKGATRVTQGMTASMELPEVSTMICFDNLASGAEFTNINGEVVSAKDTKDGTLTILKDIAMEDAIENNVPVNANTFIGIWDQVRGAGLKASTDYKDKIDMVTFARHLIATLEDEIKYVIIDGVRFSTWAEVKAAGLVSTFFKKIQMVTDANAMKMLTHDNVFKPARLKMAYQSEMNLSMVTAMACLLADPVNAPTMLIEKGLNGIAKKFGNLGVKYEVVDGKIVKYDLDLNSFGLNNESQTMSYLYKCDPKKTLEVFPGVARSNFTNEIKGIRTMLTNFSVELDRSHYTVVQSDMAVVYGEQLLAENEMFCNTVEADRVAITRHPISSLYAVSVLNMVSLEEMINRILALNISNFKKRHLINYICMAKEVCVIPASHFLMEKHDGMDFDIDSVQIIEDKDVVDCLAKLGNRGSVIRSNEKANAVRHIETGEETAILNFMANHEIGLVRPQAQEDANSQEEVKYEDNCSFINLEEVVKEEASNKYDMSQDEIGKMVEEYFNTKIASVGEIANAFYNNSLILLSLLSEGNDDVKVMITEAFRRFYKCSGKEQYKSVIDRTTASYEVDKFDCTEAVFKYAECDGSMHSLIAYLEDCCDYNRYLAETSIDSAKNNFFIVNMFSHNRIVATLGAKADCEAELVEGNKTFAKIASLYNLSEVNFFGLDLLKLEKKNGLTVQEYAECDGIIVDEDNKKSQATLAIEDPLYNVKKELTKIANRLIVLTAKRLEAVATSQDAKEMRADITVEASIFADSKIGKGINTAVDACKYSYTTLTLNLKESEEEEFEGVSKVQFMKENVVAGIRNTVAHLLSDLSTYEIGAFVCNNIVKQVSEDKCGTINSALYKVFEAEMLTYLAEKGFNNVGYIGEEIAYIECNKRYLNVADYVGANVNVVDHIANLEDNAVLVTTSKQANIEGTIVEVDGKFYVKARRSELVVAPEKGAYVNIDLKSDKFCDDLTGVEVVGYEYRPTLTSKNKKNTKLHSVIVAKDAMGKEYIAACLTVRDGLTNLLKTIDLSNISIFAVENENKTTTRVVYIPGTDYMAAVEAMNTVEDTDMGFEFSAPEGFDLTSEDDTEMDFGFSEPVFA